MIVKLLKIMLIGTFVVLICGCYQANLLVRIQPDGSGTIEEQFLMSREILLNMGSMMGLSVMGGTDLSQSDGNNYMPSLFQEQKLKDWAFHYGECVRYVSGEHISHGEFEGYKATYQFMDVNGLRIDQNPCKNVPANFLAALNRREKRERQYRFHFDQLEPFRLIVQKTTIELEDKKSHSEKENRTPPSEEDVEKAIPTLKRIFEPMRVTIQIEFDGEIVQTNADYREDKRITLMDVQFRELNQSPDLLKQLLQSPDKGYMDALEMTKSLSGIQMDENEEIIVEFE
jgi:hypothetical protein